MKADNTLILWNAGDNKPSIGDAPPGSIAVGPLESEDCYWSHIHFYEASGGAAWTARHPKETENG
jgi:hypothetical protein